MHSYIVIPLVKFKKLVSVEDAPSAPLRGEDAYPHMLMDLGLMQPRLKNPFTENSLSALSATNVL